MLRRVRLPTCPWASHGVGVRNIQPGRLADQRAVAHRACSSVDAAAAPAHGMQSPQPFGVI
jgi:hypothetical protein